MLYVPIFKFIYSFIHLFIQLFVYLFIHSFIHLYIYLFIMSYYISIIKHMAFYKVISLPSIFGSKPWGSATQESPWWLRHASIGSSRGSAQPGGVQRTRRAARRWQLALGLLWFNMALYGFSWVHYDLTYGFTGMIMG